MKKCKLMQIYPLFYYVFAIHWQMYELEVNKAFLSICKKVIIVLTHTTQDNNTVRILVLFKHCIFILKKIILCQAFSERGGNNPSFHN